MNLRSVQNWFLESLVDTGELKAETGESVECQPRFAISVILVSAVCILCMYYLFRSPRRAERILGVLFETVFEPDFALFLMESHLRLCHLLWWVTGSFLCYFVIPVCFLKLLWGLPLSKFGLSGSGYLKHFQIYVLLFLPVAVGVVAVSFLPDFQAYYPLYRNPATPLTFVLWEIAYLSQFFAIEFFYRGFLLHGVRGYYGSAAIWIMVFPYFMIHFGKPWPEAVGAFVAGVVLGILSIRTRSILGGASIHMAVALVMDMLAVWHRGWL